MARAERRHRETTAARLTRQVWDHAAAARAEIEGLLEIHRRPEDYPIEVLTGGRTAVEDYWTGHTVNSTPFRSAAESRRYLEWRGREYPLFHELTGLWNGIEGRVVLDYGCGPGNDLVGFAAHGQAARVIGVDVSESALALARQRLGLHDIDPSRVRLVKANDSEPHLPLDDASVDFISCQGVLHHTSHPRAILGELRRVLRKDGRAVVMVYSRRSLWFHLYVAYQRRLVEGIDAELPVAEAFRRSTDGPECPIATAYEPEDFAAICGEAGFEAKFVGGYFALRELDLYRRLASTAAADPRLDPDHRAFLASLLPDRRGYPRFGGLPAGIGGTYHITAG